MTSGGGTTTFTCGADGQHIGGQAAGHGSPLANGLGGAAGREFGMGNASPERPSPWPRPVAKTSTTESVSGMLRRPVAIDSSFRHLPGHLKPAIGIDAPRVGL